MIIDDINVNYIQYGNEEGKDIVLLHGWGQNIEMMKPVGNAMKKEFHITIVDLPGFGRSNEPKQPMNVENYADLIKKLLDNLNIENPILIGHSFGGRVSIVYASKYQTRKLVLLGTPFKRRPKKDSFKIKAMKKMKDILKNEALENWVKNNVGSKDYRDASPMMKKVLVETVNMDLTEYAKKINCETLLIWGSNDEAVPVEYGKELESLIRNSGMVVFENFSHFAYLENINVTIKVLDKFLEKERGK